MNTVWPALSNMRRQRPEWTPWLGVIEVILRESVPPAWDQSVPDQPDHRSNAPRLAGATVAIDEAVVQRLFDRLIRTAARAGTSEMATLTRVADANPNAVALWHASLCHDSESVARITTTGIGDAAALQAVALLLPVPFLQACNRRWAASISDHWVEPFCPVCGAWPAFAEMRGIERTRHYRCGRCGSEWHARGLTCPFCATTDHHDLVSLVPESRGASAVVDACRRCLGYLKVFNRLQGCAPLAVGLEDLGGVALDIAALELGYHRPAGAGYPINVMFTRQGGAAPTCRAERIVR
jgi:FdhE protein